MKIITVNYPRYLDNVRMGERYYWFRADERIEPYEKGDYVVVPTGVGPVCAMVEACMDSDRFRAAFVSVLDLDTLPHTMGHFKVVPAETS